VDLKTNLDLRQMSEAIDLYRRNLSTNTANEGFFWYAGHGVQIDERNYLLPLNADHASRSSLRFSSYPADQLLATLEEAGNAVNVVVLDACRNTPQLAATRGTRGLAAIASTPADIIVMYSTAAGEVAQDGDSGRNSPFTEAFLRHIDKAEPLTLVLQDISADVYRSTNNSQSPWLTGTFRTNPRYSIVRAAPVNPPPAPRPAPVQPAAVTPQPAPAMSAVEYYNRGKSYYDKKDYDRAIADFTEAIRLDPRYVAAYNDRGVSYRNKGDYDRAIADYTEAIRLNPQYTNAYNNRGASYNDGKKDYDRAIADYTEAIRLNPQYAIAYNKRGISYKGKKD
jgi:tetratricopeptide (TPR) repeat protein